jgi:hypothetical protein
LFEWHSNGNEENPGADTIRKSLGHFFPGGMIPGEDGYVTRLEGYQGVGDLQGVYLELDSKRCQL